MTDEQVERYETRIGNLELELNETRLLELSVRRKLEDARDTIVSLQEQIQTMYAREAARDEERENGD